MDMYINGEWIKSNNQLEVRNPLDQSIVGEVDLVGSKETERAIQAASEAFPKWAKLTVDQRSEYLQKVVQLLIEKKEHLAETITKEMGKAIVNARAEVDSTIAYFKWFAEEARRVNGEIIPASSSSKRISVIKQPVGVVAAITPWNFPLSMGARKLGPALAVGCTAILRPSREAPLSSLELFKIFDEVGFPKGVVNLVNGSSDEIVGTLMDSKKVRKITFTGSTNVGKILIRKSADTIKRVSMELGGHAPFIVFDDADIDLAVDGAIKSKFSSAGQQCVCANRIYVQESIYEEFASKFSEKCQQLIVGNGLDENTNIGPLVNQDAVKKVAAQVEDALNKGATLLCVNEKLEGSLYENGSFYPPTVLGNVTEEMIITFEETFGPIAPLIKFTTEEEVIQKANNIEFGLASYFYTNDLTRSHRVAEQLEYGMVGVNDPYPFVVQAPFGGIKESGLGREGSNHGIDDYLDYKTISYQLRD